MGEAGVPLDAAGRPLYPVIAWFDPRTEQYPAWWRDTFGEDRLYAVTGLKNQHIFTANKLLWLKEHEPQVFGEMRPHPAAGRGLRHMVAGAAGARRYPGGHSAAGGSLRHKGG